MTEQQERITIAQIMRVEPRLRKGLAKQKMKGIIGFVKDEPRHVTNKPGSPKEFSFYTQRISLVQGENEIYCELSIGEDDSKKLSRADKGKGVELWNVSVNMYKTGSGEDRTEIRASGEVIGGLAAQTPAPAAGNGNVARVGNGKSSDSETNTYILCQNINHNVALVIVAAMTGAEGYKIAEVDTIIPVLVDAFYQADKLIMADAIPVPVAPAPPVTVAVPTPAAPVASDTALEETVANIEKTFDGVVEGGTGKSKSPF